MEVQRRNNFVVGPDKTETISSGRGVCWGNGGIKLNKWYRVEIVFKEKSERN